MRSPVRKYVMLFSGILFLGLAYIGILLPGIPAIPFILLAAWFFMQSSERLYQWMLGRKYIGAILKKYFLEAKTPKIAIAFVISQLWISFIILQIILRPALTVILIINLAGILSSAGIYKILKK